MQSACGGKPMTAASVRDDFARLLDQHRRIKAGTRREACTESGSDSFGCSGHVVPLYECRDLDCDFSGTAFEHDAHLADVLAAHVEPLRVEIEDKRDKPKTCQVWRNGVLIFSGRDYSADLCAALRGDDAATDTEDYYPGHPASEQP